MVLIEELSIHQLNFLQPHYYLLVMEALIPHQGMAMNLMWSKNNLVVGIPMPGRNTKMVVMKVMMEGDGWSPSWLSVVGGQVWLAEFMSGSALLKI